MRIVLTVLCWTVAVLPCPVGAGEVLIVNSSPSEPYLQAIDGLNQVLGGTSYQGVKSIQQAESEVFPVDLIQTNALFNQKIKHGQVLVAVGSKALSAVAGISGPIPIVYLMATHPEKFSKGNVNITGVSLIVAPENQLAVIADYLPTVKTLGIIYDVGKSADLVKSFERSAKKRGSFSVEPKEVVQAKEVGTVLAELKDSVDALLLVPDTTVVSAVNLEALSLYSLNRNKPLIAFAPQYLKYGASLVIYSTPEAMGQQAGRMVLRLLAGKTLAETPPETCQTFTVEINPRILRKLGIESGALGSALEGGAKP